MYYMSVLQSGQSIFYRSYSKAMIIVETDLLLMDDFTEVDYEECHWGIQMVIRFDSKTRISRIFAYLG